MTPAEEERARVVAFVREAARQIAEASEKAGLAHMADAILQTLDLVTDVIERGDHLKEPQA